MATNAQRARDQRPTARVSSLWSSRTARRNLRSTARPPLAEVSIGTRTYALVRTIAISGEDLSGLTHISTGAARPSRWAEEMPLDHGRWLHLLRSSSVGIGWSIRDGGNRCLDSCVSRSSDRLARTVVGNGVQSGRSVVASVAGESSRFRGCRGSRWPSLLTGFETSTSGWF